MAAGQVVEGENRTKDMYIVTPFMNDAEYMYKLYHIFILVSDHQRVTTSNPCQPVKAFLISSW